MNRKCFYSISNIIKSKKLWKYVIYLLIYQILLDIFDLSLDFDDTNSL